MRGHFGQTPFPGLLLVATSKTLNFFNPKHKKQERVKSLFMLSGVLLELCAEALRAQPPNPINNASRGHVRPESPVGRWVQNRDREE